MRVRGIYSLLVRLPARCLIVLLALAAVIYPDSARILRDACGLISGQASPYIPYSVPSPIQPGTRSMEGLRKNTSGDSSKSIGDGASGTMQYRSSTLTSHPPYIGAFSGFSNSSNVEPHIFTYSLPMKCPKHGLQTPGFGLSIQKTFGICKPEQELNGFEKAVMERWPTQRSTQRK